MNGLCSDADNSAASNMDPLLFILVQAHRKTLVKEKLHNAFKMVSHIVLHKDFNIHNNYDSDIALLKLVEPSVLTARVQLVCLPNRFDFSEANLENGVIGWVAGWGSDGSDILAAVLTDVQLPVITNHKCVRDTIYFTGDRGVTRTLTSNMFCAGVAADTPLEDYRTVCPGDSGSPMVFLSNTSLDSHWTVEGIVSHFFQKGACSMRRPGQYGIFTKVNRSLTKLLNNLRYVFSSILLHDVWTRSNTSSEPLGSKINNKEQFFSSLYHGIFRIDTFGKRPSSFSLTQIEVNSYPRNIP
ncbi:unnamed protein product [Darwinula stevensoni]|uniref:Peptidase S1 domain-containing protein n=1 Tax=Darwinula stevensoni TaxID=69355 RepID=A0A7R8XDV3_9CRUS|nr:unnamed protein product [Darwinula stevensoni]CAG0893637.1 unnamed protein product [Darwinula stevensoni]